EHARAPRLELGGGVEDGRYLMPDAQVPAVHHDESILDALALSKSVFRLGNRLNQIAIGPVRDDPDTITRRTSLAKPLRHPVRKSDDPPARAVRALRERRERPDSRARRRQHSELYGELRVNVLHPADERDPTSPRDERCADRDEWRRSKC